MPVHDWTRVEAGVFHDFHHLWITSIRRALNSGVLPPDYYAMADATWQSKRVAVRHKTSDRVVALIEIVSPNNKSSRAAIRSFAEKLVAFISDGIHLLVLDVFPPGPRDPHGVHPLVWGPFNDKPLELPADKPLTLAAYTAGPVPEMFVDPVAVGGVLPDMPLFLTPDDGVRVPLEATYQAAWEEVPERWREVLQPPA